MAREMADSLRALFINEGSQGPGVMGQQQAGEIVSARLRDLELDAVYHSLPPMSGPSRLATHGVPLLERVDLDGHAVRWHLTQSLRARRWLREELRRIQPDVLHIHGHTMAMLIAGVMRKLPTLISVDATVWQWHAMGIWRKVRPHSRAALLPSVRLERRAFTNAYCVLAMTEWTRRGVESVAPHARVRVHHPGVDLEGFRPGLRSERERPRALFVGGRFVEKGGAELVEVLGPDLGRRIELDVVTPHPVEPREGLRVHHLAPGSDELMELFRQADVLCLPTRGDAAPFVVLEAMASGTPVVSYDVGAIGELLGDPAAGLLVPQGDRAGLREAVLRVAGDEDLLRRLGMAGRSRCELHYDARVQVPRLLDVMREMAAERATLR